MYGMVQQYNQLTHSELKLFHAGTLKNRIGINSWLMILNNVHKSFDDLFCGLLKTKEAT